MTRPKRIVTSKTVTKRTEYGVVGEQSTAAEPAKQVRVRESQRVEKKPSFFSRKPRKKKDWETAQEFVDAVEKS